MSTEEPAWKAELRKAVAPWSPWETKQPDDPDEYPEGLMATLAPHIQAAEERGRREALREAAKCLRVEAEGPLVPEWWRRGVHSAADFIDPDKDNT